LIGKRVSNHPKNQQPQTKNEQRKTTSDKRFETLKNPPSELDSEPYLKKYCKKRIRLKPECNELIGKRMSNQLKNQQPQTNNDKRATKNASKPSKNRHCEADPSSEEAISLEKL